MKPGRAVEMTGAWKTRKTKPRFPFVSHSPWKSLRDSHIPTAPTIFVPQNPQNQIQERRPWRRIASLPLSGSFFNEKMLQRALQNVNPRIT
jgi:hypothetical protein